MASQWETAYTEDGVPYYFNSATHETRWENPTEEPPPAASDALDYYNDPRNNAYGSSEMHSPAATNTEANRTSICVGREGDITGMKG